jgi:cation:H+ antiporter
MIFSFIFLFIGLAILIFSSDYLIKGASSLAKRLGVSSLIIGLSVVALGTSLPELFISLFAIFQGGSDLVLGNIIGSNMSNTLLVLGVLAIITQINVNNNTIFKEIPFSFLGVFLLLLFSISHHINSSSSQAVMFRTEGIILLLFFAVFIYYIFNLVKYDSSSREELVDDVNALSLVKTWAFIICGAVGLYFGGEWTVSSAIRIASFFGMGEFLISATIIALGTSLPELVTSITAVIKNKSQLALGNIIGSNIFNILLILGFVAVIKPITIPSFLIFDILLLLAVTSIVFIFMFTGKKKEIDKWQAILLLGLYLIYLAFLIFRG